MKIKNLKLKIIYPLALLILLLGLLNQPAVAQSPTASPTAKPKTTSTSIPTPDKKISELKERIATRVAELNLVEKRGLLGTIATVSGTKITLIDVQNRQRIVDTDELTEFSQIKGGRGKLLDFSVGDTISAFGLYNKNSRILLARFVREAQIYHRIFGSITDLDEKNFSITVREQKKGEEVVVSYEKTTLASQLSPDAKLVKSGFSKIAVGQRIFVVSIKETALRLIYFPASPAGGPTKIATPTPTTIPAKTPTPR